MPGLDELLGSAEFQMSLLLFVALAGYLIAYGINQSAVVGIILVGIVVGPSLLGLVTYTDFVASLARLGAVVLLFTIGPGVRVQGDNPAQVRGDRTARHPRAVGGGVLAGPGIRFRF